jgi:hypothetical protein
VKVKYQEEIKKETRAGFFFLLMESTATSVLPPDVVPVPVPDSAGEGKKKKPRRRRRAKRNAYAEEEGGDEEGQPATTEASNELLRRAGWPAEVRYGVGRGRYAVAAGDVAAGAVVLRETAFASAVAAPQQGLACHGCFQYSGTPLRLSCPRCRQVSFCSASCSAPQPGGDHPLDLFLF